MPKVILISVDMLRGDAVEYYDGVKEDVFRKELHTPTFNELAEKGIVFNRCYAHCGYTTNSHATMLTGLYPIHHGIRSFFREMLRGDRLTIYEILRKHGYKTCVASDMSWVFGKNDFLGFSRGAEFFIENFSRINQEDDPEVYKWIRENRDNDFFLFYHPSTVHNYITRKDQPEKEYFEFMKGNIEKLKEGYARSVNFFDNTRLKKLVEFLKGQRLFDETIIIITSDHGEALREDHREHGQLSEKELHVPLLITHPELTHKKIENVVGLVDIIPTILGLLGITPEIDYEFDGAHMLCIEQNSRVYFAESYGATLNEIIEKLKTIQANDRSKRFNSFWSYFKENYHEILKEVKSSPTQLAVRENKFKYLKFMSSAHKIIPGERKGKLSLLDSLKESLVKRKKYRRDAENGYGFLYNFFEDPYEQKDLAMENHALVKKMEKYLSEYIGAMEEYREHESRHGCEDKDKDKDLDKDAISEQLRALGYM